MGYLCCRKSRKIPVTILYIIPFSYRIIIQKGTFFRLGKLSLAPNARVCASVLALSISQCQISEISQEPTSSVIKVFPNRSSRRAMVATCKPIFRRSNFNKSSMMLAIIAK